MVFMLCNLNGPLLNPAEDRLIFLLLESIKECLVDFGLLCHVRKVKVIFVPIRDFKGTGSYSTTLSLTSTLDRGGC